MTGGSLDRTDGMLVIFTAPSVTGNTMQSIIASCAGDANFTASSGSSPGKLIASSAIDQGHRLIDTGNGAVW